MLVRQIHGVTFCKKISKMMQKVQKMAGKRGARSAPLCWWGHFWFFLHHFWLFFAAVSGPEKRPKINVISPHILLNLGYIFGWLFCRFWDSLGACWEPSQASCDSLEEPLDRKNMEKLNNFRVCHNVTYLLFKALDGPIAFISHPSGADPVT